MVAEHVKRHTQTWIGRMNLLLRRISLSWLKQTYSEQILFRMTVHSAPSRVDLLLRQIKPWNEVNAPGPKCTESGGPATKADPTLECSECT